MRSISLWWARGAVVASLVWCCFAYLITAANGALSGPTFVEWFVLPLVLVWGGLWVATAARTSKGASRAPQRLLAETPGRANAAPLGTKIAAPSGITRFYVRSFDLFLWSCLVSYPLGLLIAAFVPAFGPTIAGHRFTAVIALFVLFTFLSLPLSLCLDALVYRICGNTPGKALLGITVHTRTGELLSPSQYLNRNYSLWARGFAFGLPVLSFVALCVSGVTLSKKGATSWDSYWGYEVIRTRQKAWRMATFIVLVSMMFIISRLGSQELGNSLATLAATDATGSAGTRPIPPRKALPDAAAPTPNTAPIPDVAARVSSPDPRTITWKNPISGLPAQFDPRWQESVSHEDQDHSLLFSTASGDQVMSVDNGPGSQPYGAPFYKPVTALQRSVENGRVVIEGQGFGAPGPETAGLYAYVAPQGEARARPFMRVWLFEGSGTHWMVTYAADAAVPQPEEAAQKFFLAVLNSTRAEQPAAPENTPDNAIKWLNPVSGKTVMLDSRWTFNPYVPDKANPWAYSSLHCSQNSSAPCSGGEEEVGVRYFPDNGDSPQTLQAFAQAMHAAQDPIYPLLVHAQELAQSDRRVWEGQAMGHARLKGPQPPEYVRFWLFRGNGGFWRVTYSAEAAFPRDPKDAENFFNAVLSTTNP